VECIVDANYKKVMLKYKKGPKKNISLLWNDVVKIKLIYDYDDALLEEFLWGELNIIDLLFKRYHDIVRKYSIVLCTKDESFPVYSVKQYEVKDFIAFDYWIVKKILGFFGLYSVAAEKANEVLRTIQSNFMLIGFQVSRAPDLYVKYEE